jgi:hypothetical protein
MALQLCRAPNILGEYRELNPFSPIRANFQMLYKTSYCVAPE